MLDSVRVRLTFWYTAVLTCVLVVLALTTYFVLRQSSMRRTDNSLVELADAFLTTVNAELHDQPEAGSLQNAVQTATSEHSFRDFVFLVFDQQNRAVVTSQDLPAQLLPTQAPPDLVQKFTDTAPQSSRQIRNVRLGGQHYRGYARRFLAEGQPYTLIVLQSLHTQNEFLEQVSGTFALIIPLAILLASIGGYFLARRSLSPVVAMSAQAGQIGATNLHERLPVQNAKDELGLLAASFNELLDRLDQSFERQRRFVADASHELRTPVAVLCGEAEVALSQSARSPEEYRESLDVLRKEAHRLKHIIEDLFTLARADAGQYPLIATDFYLDELAAECARSVRTLALAKQITIHCEAVREIPVRADEALLRRMILNLLDNAIKHTPQGGSISVACHRQDSVCTLSVADSGSGIPAEFQTHIFERFFRADKVRARTESDGGGAGLGLSICRWIAEAHQGRVELTSSGPAGSTFTFFLPLTSIAAEPPANRG
ncbi:MAG TPA: heavy metal sensor histidine kinase [Candidatus Acidoferrum sp.]|jgi:heavy metal sensor kinase